MYQYLNCFPWGSWLSPQTVCPPPLGWILSWHPFSGYSSKETEPRRVRSKSWVLRPTGLNKPDPQRAWILVRAPKGILRLLCPTIGSPRHGSSTSGCLKGTSNAMCSKADQDLSTQIWSYLFQLFCLFAWLSLEWQGHNSFAYPETWELSFLLPLSS